MKQTVVKVPNHLHRWLKAEAKRDGRTLANYMERLLTPIWQNSVTDAHRNAARDMQKREGKA